MLEVKIDFSEAEELKLTSFTDVKNALYCEFGKYDPIAVDAPYLYDYDNKRIWWVSYSIDSGEWISISSTSYKDLKIKTAYRENILYTNVSTVGEFNEQFCS